jgi:tetratricopeptide (TPR) repeat protein
MIFSFLKRVLTISFFLYTFQTLIGEDTTIVRLTKKLENVRDDSIKVDILLDLANHTSWSNSRLSNDYARQALELSEQIGYDRGKAISNFSLAKIFVDFDFKFSEKLLTEALLYAEKIDDKALVAKIQNTIGHLKNNMGEYAAALTYFESSLQYFLKNQNDSAAAANYNNIAISHKNLMNDSLAMDYYFKAVEINKRNENYLWLTSNYYNIGYDYLDVGDTINGLYYLQMALDLAKEHGFNRMFPFIYGTYSRHYLDNDEYSEALSYAQKAFDASREQLNRLQEKNALQILKEIYFETGAIDSAYGMQEKIIVVNDSIKKHERMRELDLLDIRYKYEEEISNFQLRMDLMESKNLRRELRYTLALLLAGVFIMILVFLYILQKDRIKRKILEEKTIKLENEKLSKQLEYKNKELTTNVMYLMKKNEFIADISQKLQSVDIASSDKEEVISKLVKELEKNTSTDFWEDFETRFKDIYGDFYQRLSSSYPNLSPNDLKLCAFLKLNMSTKEISSITYQSLESLKIARHRLRKKLDLTREDNLVTFLNQF